MTDSINPLAALDARRVALGMSIDVVARRSAVSSSTVERVLSGRYGAASFDTVQQIAAALGAELRIEEVTDISAMRFLQADRKARQMLTAVPGKHAAVNPTANTADAAAASMEHAAQEALVQQAIHKLLSGSNRKLWAE